jgi:hypothetical protein
LDDWGFGSMGAQVVLVSSFTFAAFAALVVAGHWLWTRSTARR